MHKKWHYNTSVLRRAFTLIELLVTVSIIGILAAIAFADVGNYKRRAFDTRSKADLHLAAMGEEAYYSDHAIKER